MTIEKREKHKLVSYQETIPNYDTSVIENNRKQSLLEVEGGGYQIQYQRYSRRISEILYSQGVELINLSSESQNQATGQMKKLLSSSTQSKSLTPTNKNKQITEVNDSNINLVLSDIYKSLPSSEGNNKNQPGFKDNIRLFFIFKVALDTIAPETIVQVYNKLKNIRPMTTTIGYEANYRFPNGAEFKVSESIEKFLEMYMESNEKRFKNTNYSRSKGTVGFLVQNPGFDPTGIAQVVKPGDNTVETIKTLLELPLNVKFKPLSFVLDKLHVLIKADKLDINHDTLKLFHKTFDAQKSNLMKSPEVVLGLLKKDISIREKRLFSFFSKIKRGESLNNLYKAIKDCDPKKESTIIKLDNVINAYAQELSPTHKNDKPLTRMLK